MLNQRRSHVAERKQISEISISSFLNALAWDIPSLMIFRFLTGLGVAAAMIVTNSYLAEFFPSSVRGKYISPKNMPRKDAAVMSAMVDSFTPQCSISAGATLLSVNRSARSKK